MARAASASVLGRFRETVERYDLLPAGSRILVAVSGGADSVCLLDLLRAVASLYRLELVGFHLNHGLRPTAKRDEEFVRRLFGDSSVVVVRSRVREFARSHRMGIEEAGRTLRYRHMERTARERDCGRVALGHTADDNLETMLLNLARGAGLEGISGIPVQRGRFIRPMIDIERDEVIRYLEARRLSWIEDETNRDASFRRNLVRLQAVPALKVVNQAAARSARRAAELLAEEDEFLDGLARAALTEVVQSTGRQKRSRAFELTAEMQQQKAARHKGGRAVVDCMRFSLYNMCLKRRMVRQLIPELDSDGIAKAIPAFSVGPDAEVVLNRAVRLVRRTDRTRVVRRSDG